MGNKPLSEREMCNGAFKFYHDVIAKSFKKTFILYHSLLHSTLPSPQHTYKIEGKYNLPSIKRNISV